MSYLVPNVWQLNHCKEPSQGLIPDYILNEQLQNIDDFKGSYFSELQEIARHLQ